ncbi:hypothetical protein [Bacillus sp. UNC41MFS5]|uniref:hypothetical protein n=1 Tax=Bacillus sp. UNC41MFS5 TaxID=1449046 RepID=UPI00047C2862|nr:hypothetical protein [Bacillus sp. UNC41MFS5]
MKEKKGIMKILFGDLPFLYLFNINSKLNSFDKVLNYIWYIFFIISFILVFISVPVSSNMYLIINIPILIMVPLSLFILSRKDFGLQRFFYLGCTVFIMFLSNQWIDLYSFVKKDYTVFEGVPSKVERLESRYGKRGWEIIINDDKLLLPLKLKKEEIKRGMEIQYLPHSKFIIKYKFIDKK